MVQDFDTAQQTLRNILLNANHVHDVLQRMAALQTLEAMKVSDILEYETPPTLGDKHYIPYQMVEDIHRSGSDAATFLQTFYKYDTHERQHRNEIEALLDSYVDAPSRDATRSSNASNMIQLNTTAYAPAWGDMLLILTGSGSFVIFESEENNSDMLEMGYMLQRAFGQHKKRGMEYRSEAAKVAELTLLWLGMRGKLQEMIESLTRLYNATTLPYQKMARGTVQQLLTIHIATALDTTLWKFQQQRDTPWVWQEPLFLADLTKHLENGESFQHLVDTTYSVVISDEYKSAV